MSIKRLDPLAQSFFVNEPIFITKVDLFFASKDDNLPVFVQLLRNSDGAPSQDIVNYSTVVVPAANILTSSNANVKTTVSFSSPVFLDIGEYSLTLGSDSKDYTVYISELNGEDITTERRITEQPLIGSLFKSQNASEWVSSPFEDLKMNLYRARFYTNVTSTVNLALADGYDLPVSLETDPLEVFPNSTLLKVYHFNHALVNGSYISLRNVANANVDGNAGTVFGLSGNLIEDVYFEVANVKFDSYTITLPSNVAGVTEPTRFGGPGVFVETNYGYSSITPSVATYRPANTTATHKIITTTPGSSYTIDSQFTTVNNGVVNTFDTKRVVAGKSNKIYKTANVESLQYRVELSTNNDKVSPIIDTKLLGITLKRNLVNEPTYNGDVLPHEVDLIANATAAGNVTITQLSGNTGLIFFEEAVYRNNANAILNGSIITVAANVANPNDGQYRVVSILDGGANVRVVKLSTGLNTDAANVYNVINSPSFIAEEAATGGSAYSKYITRQVDFVNPSTSIKFLLDISKPADADVEFYFKTKLAGDTTNLRDVEYTKIGNVVITTSLAGEYYEYSQQIDNIPAFNSLIFKIVLLSTNEAQVPKIKNFRLIALE